MNEDDRIIADMLEKRKLKNQRFWYGIIGFILGISFCFCSTFAIGLAGSNLATPISNPNIINSTYTPIATQDTILVTPTLSAQEVSTIISNKITQTATNIPPTSIPNFTITPEYIPPTIAYIQPTIYPTAVVQPSAEFTMSQLNAIEQAQSYLHIMAFSRSGLIDQLVFEKYSATDATFAVDSLNVDWTEQAYLKAKSYLDNMSFSLEGLIGQLEFEGFTAEQATTGATRAYSE